MTTTRITFVDAIAEGFRGWRNFSGTASRPQFWYWTLFTVLVNMVLSTLDLALFPAVPLEVPRDPAQFTGANFVTLLDAVTHDLVLSVASWAELVLLVPTIAVTARRFRDGGWPAALGVMVRVVPYVATPAIVALGYSVAGIVDDTSDAALGTLLGATLGFLALGIVSFASVIVMFIGTVRPTRSHIGA